MKTKFLALFCAILMLSSAFVGCNPYNNEESTTPEEEITPAESTTPEEITTPEPDPFADFVGRPVDPLPPYVVYIIPSDSGSYLQDNGFYFGLLGAEYLINLGSYSLMDYCVKEESNIPDMEVEVQGIKYSLVYKTTELTPSLMNRKSGTRNYRCTKLKADFGFDVQTKDLVYFKMKTSAQKEIAASSNIVLDKDACKKIATDYVENYVKNSNKKIDLSEYVFTDVGNLKEGFVSQFYEFAYYKKAANGYLLNGDYLCVKVTTSGTIIHFECGDDLSYFDQLYPTIDYDLAESRVDSLAKIICERYKSLSLDITCKVTEDKKICYLGRNYFYITYSIHLSYEYEGKPINGTLTVIVPL